ncbi:MAG: dihydroneopterin aldolase [Pseudomonadota bacterium]|nr:dihydroneopterin aldolase [Pseudomonadota bacterium]
MKNKVKNISIISTGSWVPPDLSDKKIRGHTYKILVNNLILDASIGIHDFEKKRKQKISISLEIDANDNIPSVSHHIENFVSYEYIVRDIKDLIDKGHIELLETLSENIFKICFKDSRIQNIKIKLEKLEVFSEADSVGIEVNRSKDQFKNFKNKKI